MFAEEWPLMMFTLLSQLAIGSYVVLLLIRMSLLKSDESLANKLTNQGFLWVGPIMAVALLLSVFHLGDPFGAYRSILNVGSSWLSREILTAGGFFGFWFLSYLSFKKGNSGVGLGFVTTLFGLAAIFSMASIYATSIRPAWSHINTYIAFYGATFAMGSVGALTFLSLAAKGTIPSQASGILKNVALISVVAIMIPLVFVPVLVSSLGSGVPAAQASAELLTGTYMIPLIIRAVISLGGAALLFMGIRKNRTFLPTSQVMLALVLIVAGEFIGRYVFYASGISLLMGQNMI